MPRFPTPKPKAEPRNPWAGSMRERLSDWLEEHSPPTARGIVAGNGGVDIFVGAHRVASFLPTSTGLSVYLIGSTDSEVTRIEHLCERAGVPAEARPPRTSKYVLIKVRDDTVLETIAEALRLHCIGKA
jgi:hypothetical protein